MRLGYAIILICSLLFACKKEEDDQKPQVFIFSPSDNSFYGISDEIPVKASITDNGNIKQVILALYNSNTRVLADKTHSFYPNASSYNLDFVFRINDSLLSSGSYYFKVTAFDEHQDGVDFRSINITGIPKRFIEAIVAVSDNGNTSIYGINQSGSLRTLFTYNGTCKKIGMDSRNQILWIIDLQNRIIAYDVKENKILWDQLLPNTGILAFITDLLVYDGKAYLSTRNGEIRAYNTNFSDVFTYRSASGWYPKSLHLINGYLVTEEVETASGDIALRNIFFKTGGLNSSTSIARKFLGLRDIVNASGELLEYNDSIMRLYNFYPESGLKSLLTQKPLKFVSSAYPHSEKYWLIEADSNLYQFNQQTGYVSILQAQAIDNVFTTNSISNEILVGNGNQLSIYQMPGGAISATQSFTGTIKGLAVRYNY